MIYIIAKQSNVIVTDNLTDIIPSSVLVFLDNEEVGTFSDTSPKKDYIDFEIPSINISTFENKEYTMKLVSGDNGTVIKTELVVIRTNLITPSNTVINNKKDKFYEN